MKTAEQRAKEMMHMPCSGLHPLAMQFADAFCRRAGPCAETILHAFVIYAQVIEGLKCATDGYVPTYDDFHWFRCHGVTDFYYPTPNYPTPNSHEEHMTRLVEPELDVKRTPADSAPTVPQVELKQFPLDAEEWREYDFQGRVYRIDNPKTLIIRSGGTTHRVVDSNGVVHCPPAPGQYGCVLRWKNRDGLAPVQF